MKYILIKIIRIYQVIFSVFVGQHCRFTPTCSNYAIDAVENHGFSKGLILSTKGFADATHGQLAESMRCQKNEQQIPFIHSIYSCSFYDLAAMEN